MDVLPKNRHLLIKVIEEPSKKESTILVPDDYQVSIAKQYELAKVVASSGDCESYEAGQHILVEGHMVKNVSILGEHFQFVLENYVVAAVGDIEV